MLTRAREVIELSRRVRSGNGVGKEERRVKRFLKTDNLKLVPPSSPDPHRYMAFYKYAKIKDPEKACEDMRRRLEVLGGLGRIYISKEGVNAQLSVPAVCFDAWLYILKKYCDQWCIGPVTMSIGGIATMETEEERPFSKLTIKVRNRIVQDALPPDIDDSLDMASASSLSIDPSEWHNKMMRMNEMAEESLSKDQSTHSSLHHDQSSTSNDKTSTPLLVDCRNYYESQIGMFRGAVRLPVDRFSESFSAIDKLLEHEPHDRELLLYCTGGIRCEKVGAYLKQIKGRKNISTLQGGINRYAKFIDQINSKSQSPSNNISSTTTTIDQGGQDLNGLHTGQSDSSSPSPSIHSDSTINSTSSSSIPSYRVYPSSKSKSISSFFKGINYQFDKRNKFGLKKERVTEDVIAKCEGCGRASDHMRNCSNPVCNILLVLCESCHSKLNGACSPTCQSISSLPEEERLQYERDEEVRLARHLYSRSFHSSKQKQKQDHSKKSVDARIVGHDQGKESITDKEGRLLSKSSKKEIPEDSSHSHSHIPSLPFVRSKAYLSEIIQETSAIEYRKRVLLQYQDHPLLTSHSSSSSNNQNQSPL
jgi:predicted sulfurtransferase